MTMMVGALDARALLRGLYLELTAEYDEAAADAVVVSGASDRAGDDEADLGSKVALREHQLSLLQSIRDRRDQVEHALRRLDEGTYGQCEQCRETIDPARLEVFPAATSCVRCKRR